MTNKIEMQLSNPLTLGAYSLALLSIGAGIGAHWGHYPHVAVWMVVLGAVLMVAHDMLGFSIIFYMCTAWALRANSKRDLPATNEQCIVSASRSRRTSSRTGRVKTRQED
jgi:hypothetical protein